jgi:hypothetical protein
MGQICDTHMVERNAYMQGDLKGRDHLEDLGIDERTILQ